MPDRLNSLHSVSDTHHLKLFIMAEVQVKSAKKKSGVKRLLKKNLSVDLTPMVDMGFLLITFFILTTSLTTPTVTNLIMPKDGVPPDMPVCESCALTLLPAGNNEVYYYEGIPTENTVMHKTSFAATGGLRDLIESKQQKVAGARGTKDEMVVIIKPGKNASYENIMNILDEMKINGVTHYVIGDKEALEKKLVPED